MRERNIDFLEKYKRVDHFVRDAYASKEGVNKYLSLMEQQMSKGSSMIVSWEGDYKKLKHARWIRNQLVHTASIDSEICSLNDYEWICRFYRQLMNANDPVTRLYMAEQEQGKKESIDRKKMAVEAPENPTEAETKQISRWRKFPMLFAGMAAAIVFMWVL